ncbi:MAG: 50S ribosomal protein L5 [Patescibacteria group bacterium]|jgi:large subunit ribosomal protein L5|nr:50S ribosomal protein L5 [Patescibacteria group bacterium]MDD3778298.1 50S ribosomal protein L5 [Patescibacteria group bacterium]MDD3939308.1 50S ribosomal protein L5 [Patescibacteria group bacterium]MDD4443946.1 50S ribosomal protein L5 [Patescibacteria group bacterium]
MRFKEKYQKEIVPALMKKLAYKNKMLAPRLNKVVINVGCGRHTKDKEFLAALSNNLEKITGQKIVFTLAKKSVSAFKIREGMTVGAKVSLRGERMYDFVEKLVSITFPRVRDFRGISTKVVDRTGNMTIGFKDQSAFPEIKVEDMDNPFGVEISFSTTARNREEGLELFRLFGFPFKPDNKKESK